jgi:hypothetical protein
VKPPIGAGASRLVNSESVIDPFKLVGGLSDASNADFINEPRTKIETRTEDLESITVSRRSIPPHGSIPLINLNLMAQKALSPTRSDTSGIASVSIATF